MIAHLAVRIISVAAVLGFLVSILGAQANFEVHMRGQLWETMKDDGTIGAPNPTEVSQFFPSMDWPGGPLTLPSKDEQRSYCFGAGVWIGGRHDNGDLFFTENGPFGFVDQGEIDPIVKVTNFVGDAGFDPQEAEEVITAGWTTTENIHASRTSRAWSYPGLNNFIIMEYEFTNQNSGPVSEVYFGFPYLLRPSYQDMVVHNGWGDDLTRTDEQVRYDSNRGLLYAYDDTPNSSLPTDVGNWWDDREELRTPGFAGYAVIAADPADGGGGQPAVAYWAQLLGNGSQFTSASNTDAAMYELLSGQDTSLKAQGTDVLTPITFLACGPYTLAAGATISIVVVEAVNGIGLEVATGVEVDSIEARQQQFLDQGFDSLSAAIDRAIALYNAEYVLSRVPPPAPDIEILPLPSSQSMSLTWDPLENDWVNPITGRADIEKYVVYRTAMSFNGPFEVIKNRIRVHKPFDISSYYNTDLGKWLYIDTGIALGVGYFYAVTTVDSTGNESWMTNRNDENIKAASYAAENTLNVKVFPNPFRKFSGIPTPGEENTIVWTNLPAECTVRIYTASGELVRTLEHFNPTAIFEPDDPNRREDTGDEVWDQLSLARQRVAPGIYFWTVESAVGNAQGTLLIIK